MATDPGARLSRPPRTAATLSLLVLLVLALGGCNDSPTEPRQPPLVFAGFVEYQGRASHVFAPNREGTVTITLLDLNPRLVDVTLLFNPATAVVGLGIGRTNDEGECVVSGQTTLMRGERQLYGLNVRQYCVTLFDPGNFPQDSSFNYRLQVELPD